VEENQSVTGGGPDILETEHLKKYFPVLSPFIKRRIGWIKALNDVSYRISRGEVVGIVGESGCGKSTLGKTIVGILSPTDGSVKFKGNVIGGIFQKKAHSIKRGLQYVYQDAGASLDPWWTIRASLSEPLIIHTKLPRAKIQEKVLNILSAVGLGKEYLSRYPHEFSGGQQRRLGLARILVLNPEVIVLDEPTSGLDVSVQATILKLLIQLKQELELTYVIISHNLAVVRMMCDRVAIMYLGKFIECGESEAIFMEPKHPYAKFLLAAIPEPGKRKQEVFPQGEPPDPANYPSGCSFWPRCPYAMQMCKTHEPRLQEVDNAHWVACHLYTHEVPP